MRKDGIQTRKRKPKKGGNGGGGGNGIGGVDMGGVKKDDLCEGEFRFYSK